MNARYVMLIQKQFDEPLSERETYELQGFLAGNEAAARLCENMQRILEESEQIELPEQLKPLNSENLLAEILSAIAKTESKSWFSLVKNFVKGKDKKAPVSLTHQDELAVLRKHKASTENRTKAMDALRSRVIAEVAPVSPHDAVSLAVAIKQRMFETQNESQLGHSDQQPPEILSPTEAPPEPLTPSLSKSMDQLFSSSNWPVINPEDLRGPDSQLESQPQPQVRPEPQAQPEPQRPLQLQPQAQHQIQPQPLPEFTPLPGPAPFSALVKNRLHQQQQEQQRTSECREPMAPGALQPWSEPVPEEQMEPIWQLDLEAQVAAPQNPPQPETLRPVPQNPPQPETLRPVPQIRPQPEILKPAGLIPVDDIIAHVSLMFSEPAKDYAPNTIPPYPAGSPANSEQPPADPLGLASGSYPQINSIDLQKATSARLAKTIPTDESQGRIKGLGNFLLDEQSAAAIGNLSSSNTVSNARILSDEEAMALQECLSPIERLQGVAGCIILGYDGMVIMSSLPEHADKDALSAWALLTYMNSHDLIRVIGHARLRQFVSRTISGYLLLADFGQGLLLAVSDNASTEAILPLMKSVRKVTAA